MPLPTASTTVAGLAVVLAALGPSCGDEPPAAACTPPSTDPAAPQSLRSGDQERHYLLSIPDRAPEIDGFPLIVDLHGHGGSATEHEANTELAARGRDEGFVVATPEGLGEPRRWNFDRRPDGPDDYAFVTELVDHLARTACVDADRVHLAGSSNGAAFAGLLACTEGFDAAAVAMVIATVPPTCAPAVQPSVLTIRGTADTHVPYAGTPEIVQAWADHDRCPAPARTDEPQPGVTRTTYDRCGAGARSVVLTTVDGGIHSWPGSPAADRPDNSPAGATWPATTEILDFFAAAADRDRETGR
jgi:polyhydroxybutyrate depolymerase